MKKTPWFPAHIKPVRVGVYEVEFDGVYSHWDGDKWLDYASTVRDAANCMMYPLRNQTIVWRGLVKEAK